ncbi:aspartate kinase [Candidatus Gottesmanbacteria bacterium RBG_16_43_7]|uniref:Uridylate kinase n=1 Tax=Candidatus Gottesmanbacteria bacterium RBG_16_43_7 TaxID=1798373 RepID=A0A1F5Z7Q0_9BACT|nr:MAG: aspartate kinase [Candidatus Gottesmanbacteria bacterium RBG_16_43_7]
MVEYKQSFVLSLGGSLFYPNGGGIDTQFLKDFNKFIRDQISFHKRRFFIVVGGGAITRHYQSAAREVRGSIDDDDLDWLGIHSTRLNAHMIRVIFRDIAHSHVIKHYEIIRKADEPVVVAAGWKPGWSTDYDAITLCQDYGIAVVINLTNVDQVFDKDPKKFPNAKPLVKISWGKYRAMAGDKWVPGMNLPFDPIASKLADELSVTVKILNGRNFSNLKNALDGKPFVGTTIS